MPDLKLTLACWDYDRTRPLIDGRVKPEGIDLDIEILRPRQAFQRMLDKKEFDVSELSLASYTALKGRGECPFAAVPVALSKIFRHSCIYVRSGAGISTPQDLKGKRVGTSQWGSTGLVFMRGMLQHDYGVRPQDMHWFMGGLNTFVEPPLIALNLPKDIRLDFLSGTQTLEQMFAAGELDALLSLYIPKLFLEGSPAIARLFPNYKEVEQDYYRRTRILPIMHTVVLREDIYRAHPWAARSIYRAFVQARDLAVGGLYDTDALRVALPWLIDHVKEARRVFGADFWAYGLEPNRPTFEAIGRYVHEQGLSPRMVGADELFAPRVTRKRGRGHTEPVARVNSINQRLNGLLRKREPLRPYRHGWSIALVSPMRGPTATSMSCARAKIANGGSSNARPYCAPVIPSAWHSRPGPAHNSRSSATPRRRRIAASPCVGASARISIALALPCASHTKLRHQWMP